MTVIWKDNEDGSGAIGTPLGLKGCYMVVGSCWWFDPSNEAPQFAGQWNGDLQPAKGACIKDYEVRKKASNG